MLKGRNLVVDTFSEVYDLLKPWITHEFWDFAAHEIISNSIYVICRKQFSSNADKITEILLRNDLTVFFDNAAEGSSTLVGQLRALNLDAQARDRRLLLIGGGDMEPEYANVQYDHFLSHIVDYNENIQAMSATNDIFSKVYKPYKFLFLNGRTRPHRKYLYERFKQLDLLDSSLWTMLDSSPSLSRSLKLMQHSENVMCTTSPLRRLPLDYEFSNYKNTAVDTNDATQSFIKHQLFDNEWGEIYLEPSPYIDTYFSLVTETVFEYPYSFRTEKIAKPLMIGHPFIAVSGAGYYRDLRNLGFKTFDHVVDESFDQIQHHQTRIDRIVDIVEDLCQQDLRSFLSACQETCKYNQQHLLELSPRLRTEFPQRFFSLIDNYE
jgi:hypothetical protein